MNAPTKKMIRLQDLRQRAQSRLNGPSGPSDAQAGAAALGVLHQLASSSATADQALTLLHEIQVHQVEIDMQADELRTTLTGCEDALDRQLAYHDAMPVACCNLDAGNRLLEINETGARWLGMARQNLLGQTIHAFLTPEGKQALCAKAEALQRGEAPGSWEMTLLSDKQTARSARAALSADTVPGRHILVLMDLAGKLAALR
jgi:hypothetical protein